ncbi:MAG: hypothetical protein M1829_002597 [Trizodia sp. TS-e1964]|nr:MAG: hypothetical protein M1829_002597 [Trizodia sp. TS-e1964]
MDNNEGMIDLGHPVPPQEMGHRRQQSLQDIIKFAFQRPVPPLLEAQRVQAIARFSQLLAMYRAHLPHTAADRYDSAKVVELFHEYALSEVSKDRILRYFLAHIAGVSKEEQDDIDLALTRANTLVPEDQQRSRITEFAEHLHAYFFSALRAGGGATREPSAALSPDRTVQRIGVGNRPPSLKDLVSFRERHRCTISGAFSDDEYQARWKADGADAKDDDGVLFTSFEYVDRRPTETAHIIPHSIGARSGKNEMLVSVTSLNSKISSVRPEELTDVLIQNDSQLAALHLLDMFDPTATALIDGAGIDTPKNAILLASEWHHFFGTFQVYFDKVDNQANTYTVCVTNPNQPIRPLPRTVTFESETIELPSPHLFALHKAVAKIMYLTGAGEYTNHLDRYDSADTIAADGTTNLANLLNLRLFTSPIRAY